MNIEKIANKIANEKSSDDVFNLIKSELKRHPHTSYADYRKENVTSNSMLLSVRDWGVWESRDDRKDEEDDDFEEPTKETQRLMNQIIKKFQNELSDFEISWDYSEKNWIYVQIRRKNFK